MAPRTRHIRMCSAALTFALVAMLMMSVTPTVAAAGGPVFTVMNTSETLPDGVWFRNSPHTADTDRVTGHGVYAGDQVQLGCYAFGDVVGPYNDSLWYYVTNLTRPAVPNTGAANVGYLNAHYINDGMVANQIVSGVPACGASGSTPPTPPTPFTPSTPTPQPPTPATTPEGASAFFLPPVPIFQQWFPWMSQYSAFDQLTRPPSTAEINVPYAQWAPGGCNYGGGVVSPYGGRWVSIIGGFSIGRLGPVYYLANASSEQRAHVHYMLLVDPGSATEFSGGCDNAQVGHIPVSQTLANWLALNPGNHLMILAAESTGQDDGNGLTNYYLTAIRDRGLLGQVTVCWDDHLKHEEVYDTYAANPQTSLMSRPSTSCPAGY